METNISETVELTCKIHGENTANAYCLNHRHLLCMKCTLSTHKECVNEDQVEHIGNVTHGLENQIPGSIDVFQTLRVDTQQWRRTFIDTVERLEETEKRLTTGLEQLRVEMIEQINHLATDAQEIVKSVIADQRTMVKNDISQLVGLEKKVSEIHFAIEQDPEYTTYDRENMLFIVHSVRNLQSRYENTELMDRNIKLQYYVSNELQYVRNNLKSFGELSVEEPNSKGVGRRRLSNASTNVLSSMQYQDDMYSLIFVEPPKAHMNSADQGVYASISVDPITCKPPPLPEQHPAAHVDKTQVTGPKYQTMPRMRLSRQDMIFNTSKEKDPLPIPPIPKKRPGSLSCRNTDYNEENINNPSKIPLAPNNLSKNHSELSELVVAESGASDIGRKVPDVKVRPPSITSKLIQLFEERNSIDPNKLSPNLDKSSNIKLRHSQSSSDKLNSDSSEESGEESDQVFSRSLDDKIPALPKMHKMRSSLNTRSLSQGNEKISHHSGGEYDANPIGQPTSQTTPSLVDRSTPKASSSTRLNSSISSNDSDRSFLSMASSNTSFASSNSSSNRDSAMSEASCDQTAIMLRRKHPQRRVVSPLDTETRKTMTFNLFSFKNDSSKSQIPPQHSTITGVAVTASGSMLICDTENNCLQLFDNSGTPLYDYRIAKPFSCCSIRDELVAVTSYDRKSLCMLDISDSKIAFIEEHTITTDGAVLGVGHTKGFVGICCAESVVILTESLQPYKVVKPLVMLKKKGTKPYFVDVRFIAMEWTKVGFFIYTSEHKNDRVSCVVVGQRDRAVWNCHVGKPEAVLVHKKNVIVAGKHKLVVLEAATGQRLREIHDDVPTHPVHMAMVGGNIYISKTASSSQESRNIRKIHFSTE